LNKPCLINVEIHLVEARLGQWKGGWWLGFCQTNLGRSRH
jgi:hypothetical protein